MSKRKRYRALRNQAIKDNLKKFEEHRKAHREEREASSAQEQLGRARLLYATFHTELCSEPRTAPQIIAAIEAFKDAIRKVVKDKHALSVIISEINWAQTRFIAAYGPKGPAQVEEWQAEAKKLRTSNRRTLPNDERDGGANLANN